MFACVVKPKWRILPAAFCSSTHARSAGVSRSGSESCCTVKKSM